MLKLENNQKVLMYIIVISPNRQNKLLTLKLKF
jgi:hypothetical protein